MAEHNGIKYDSDLQKTLDRLGAVGLEEDGVTRLGETLTPVLNWRDFPEWYYVAGRDLASSRDSVAAGGAGFRSIIYLSVPANSRKIVIVRAVTVMPQATTNQLAWMTATTGSISASPTPRDWRKLQEGPPGMTNQGSPVAQVFTANGAAIASNRVLFDLNNNAGNPWFTEIPPIIMLPGAVIALCPNTDNIAIVGGFHWEERNLLPSGEPARGRGT